MKKREILHVLNDLKHCTTEDCAGCSLGATRGASCRTCARKCVVEVYDNAEA